MLELLSALERKYGSKRPLYLILGDFNLYLEQHELSEGWGCYPKDRKTARNLRPRRPLDYILARGFFHFKTPAREFSPLPLKIERNDSGIVSYGFSNGASLLSDDRKPISWEDLEHELVNRTLNITLLGNLIICNTKLTSNR